MPPDDKLSGLTKSLLVGISLGAITLTQVGCVPVTTTSVAAGSATDPHAVYVGSEGERKFCKVALRSQSPSDVNALLQLYPSSRCIAPLLSALPVRVLAGLSPAAVEGISPAVVRTLPARVLDNLPGGKPPAVVAGVVRIGGTPDRY